MIGKDSTMDVAASFNWAGIASLGAAVVAAGIVYAYLSGYQLPLVRGERSAFLLLWVVGLTMSILAGMRDAPNTGGQPDASVLGWTLNPLVTLGILSFAMLPVAMVGVRLPTLGGHPGFFVVLAAIIGIKWILAHLHFVF
jgi:hypothetical protein